MANINRVVLVGNLTKDPELRHTPSGTPVCKLRLAVNTRQKDAQGNWGDKPNYFDVTVWGNQGESCAQYLSKGRPVGVDGRLDWREWEAQDGSKRQAVEIIADTVQFLGSRGDADGGAGPASSLLLLQGEDRRGRLQELQPAAAAHLGEGQDPLAPDHRHVPPPPEASCSGSEARARDGAVAIRIELRNEGRPPRRHREARPARRGRRRGARLCPQLPAAPQARRARDSGTRRGARESQRPARAERGAELRAGTGDRAAAGSGGDPLRRQGGRDRRPLRLSDPDESRRRDLGAAEGA